MFVWISVVNVCHIATVFSNSHETCHTCMHETVEVVFEILILKYLGGFFEIFFSIRCSYSFSLFLSKLGTHALCADVQKKLWKRFPKFW